MSDPIEQPVMMTSPDGKESYKVVPDDIEYAKSQGWKPSEQFDKEQNFEKQVEAKDTGGFFEPQEGGLADTLVDKVISGLTLGVSPTVQNKMDDRSPEVKAIVAARKERTEAEHPYLTGAANILGSADTAVLTGGGSLIGAPIERGIAGAVTAALGEKAAANVVTKIGTAITKNALISEAYNTPSQVIDLTTGDKQAAAENLGYSLGYGGLIGAISIPAGAMFNKFVRPTAAQKLASAMKEQNITFKDNLGNVISPDKMRAWVARQPKNSLHTILTTAADAIQKNKDDADAAFTDLNHPNPAEVSDTTIDAASKLGQANTSPINPTQPFVNPAHVANDFSADALKDTKIASDPMYAQVKGAFGEAGSNPITHEETDALRNKLESLPDHPLKDLALKKLDDTQERSLHAAMSKLNSGEDLPTHILNQENLKYGNALQDSGVSLASNLSNKVKDLANKRYDRSFTGNMLDTFAPNAGAYVKKIATNMVDLPIKKLNQLIEGAPHLFGGALARALNEAMDGQIEKIPSILAGTITPFERKDPLNSQLGGGSGLSQDQKYNKFTSAVINSQANPDSISDNYGALLSLFHSDPHLQNLIAQHNTNALSYLNSIVPKNPNPPQAFSKNDWQPTKAQKADFLSQLAIVDNPMLAVHKIADGSITLKDMTTLKTVYPALTDKMLGKVNQYAFSPEAVSASPGKRIAVAKATGTQLPLLNPTNVSRNQSTFSQATPQQNPNGSPPNPRHTNTSLKGGPSYQTEAGRLQYKGVN